VLTLPEPLYLLVFLGEGRTTKNKGSSPSSSAIIDRNSLYAKLLRSFLPPVKMPLSLYLTSVFKQLHFSPASGDAARENQLIHCGLEVIFHFFTKFPIGADVAKPVVTYIIRHAFEKVIAGYQVFIGCEVHIGLF
jgi:hypothetical protein